MTLSVELIFVPKHECKINTLFCGSLCDSITIVFSSGILGSSKFEIISFMILNEPLRTLVLKLPTLLAVLKSTGMFTPSHLGTGISCEDLIGITLTLNDFSSMFRTLH